MPKQPYVVCERHLRLDKGCLVSFEAQRASVPWLRVRRHMRVDRGVTHGTVALLEPWF